MGKDKWWDRQMMNSWISLESTRGKAQKYRGKKTCVKTTNKTRDRWNIKWGIYYGYILVTKVRVRFLECYKVFCQVGLLFGSFFSHKLTALSLFFFTHTHSFIGIYSTVLCALYPKTGMVPETSQSHSWNPLAIKTQGQEETRERELFPPRSTDNQLHLQPCYKHSIEALSSETLTIN